MVLSSLRSSNAKSKSHRKITTNTNFRRIVCLTDGYNTSNVTYDTALQCTKVIIDKIIN